MRNHSFHKARGYTPISEIGWSDYREGRTPYPDNYDSLPEKEQRNYENGRLRAANAALAFGHTPRLQTREVIARAYRLVGSALP